MKRKKERKKSREEKKMLMLPLSLPLPDAFRHPIVHQYLTFPSTVKQQQKKLPNFPDPPFFSTRMNSIGKNLGVVHGNCVRL